MDSQLKIVLIFDVSMVAILRKLSRLVSHLNVQDQIVFDYAVYLRDHLVNLSVTHVGLALLGCLHL